MGYKQRLSDILKTGLFEDNEVEHERENIFKSWEYYLIIHFTNQELYYLSDEEKDNYSKIADLELETNEGFLFAFS
jgi:hypothetical protein